MKKLYLLLILILILTTCACNDTTTSSTTETAQNTNTGNQIEIADITYGTFSYAEDSQKYKVGDKGVINWGLKNTTEQNVKDGYTAVTIAHNELIVVYDQISADYDETSKVWRVNFYLEGSETDGNQIVYIDEKGKTIMYVWGIQK